MTADLFISINIFSDLIDFEDADSISARNVSQFDNGYSFRDLTCKYLYDGALNEVFGGPRTIVVMTCKQSCANYEDAFCQWCTGKC